jgi:hypothetical protein
VTTHAVEAGRRVSDVQLAARVTTIASVRRVRTGFSLVGSVLAGAIPMPG